MLDVATILRMIYKRWWLIAATSIIGVVAGVFYGLTAPRYYRASTSVQLNPRSTGTALPFSVSADQPFSEIAASNSAYLHSTAFGALVVNELKVPATPQQLVGAISTSVAANTTILNITVTWDNPQYAADIANGVAQIFVREDLKRQEASQGPALAELQNSFDYYKARIDPLRQLRDDTQQQVNQGDVSKLNQLNQLDSQLNQLEDTYSKLLVSIENARSALDTATIIDPATVPIHATGAGVRKTLVFGGALGLVAGLSLLLLLEYFDNTVKSTEELHRISGVAALGSIGVISPPEDQTDGSMLVTVFGPKDPITEAFRSVRTTLSFLSVERPLRQLVVTSTLPEEGKTVIASNLAVSLAQAGNRVILVDADLRVPRIHTQFGLPNHQGLGSLLLPGSEVELLANLDVLLQRTPVDRLRVLTSGPLPPNPAELLGSTRLTAIAAALNQICDVVVYDTPPMMPVTDAVVLASRVDWTILVARTGRTRREALHAAVQKLRTMDVRLAGVILNMVDHSPLSPYYKYHYYNYYGHNGPNGRSGGGRAPARWWPLGRSVGREAAKRLANLSTFDRPGA